MSHEARKGTSFLVSLMLHAGLALAIVIVPLFLAEALPSQERRAFLPPLGFAPLPPPPRAVVGRIELRPATKPAPSRTTAFVAPVPDEVELDDGAALLGEGDARDGLDGGVDDGVRGGVVGSVIDELPASVPAPPRAVRINNGLAAARLVHRVEPVYPAIAAAARLGATVVLEAEVDARGQVASVSVQRGHPLFDQAALDAVRQWRYRPLLLNGVPTPFLLTVTVRFDLVR